MTFPQGTFRKGEAEMKKSERLSLALLQTSPC